MKRLATVAVLAGCAGLLSVASYARDDYDSDAWFEHLAEQTVITLRELPSEPIEERINVFKKLDQIISQLKNADAEMSSEADIDPELQRIIENPQWLHGIDVVHRGNDSPISEFKETTTASTDSQETLSKIWVAGWDGLILFSEDEGVLWETQKSNTKSNLEAVDFVDDTHGWVVGHGGVILNTSNGGADWQLQFKAGDAPLLDVFCLDRSHCWAGGEYKHVFRTQNGGKQWKPSEEFGAPSVGSIVMLDREKGFAVTRGPGSILKTEDGGETWTVTYRLKRFGLLPSFGRGFFEISAVDGDVLWAVGSDMLILKTVDGGQTWISQSENVHAPSDIKDQAPTLTSILAFDRGRAVAAGLNGLIMATSDGGNTWWIHNYPADSALSIYAMDFRNRRVGWTAGNYGHVLATNSAGSRWAPMRGFYVEAMKVEAEAMGISIEP